MALPLIPHDSSFFESEHDNESNNDISSNAIVLRSSTIATTPPHGKRRRDVDSSPASRPMMVDSWPSNAIGTISPAEIRLTGTGSMQLAHDGRFRQLIAKPKFLNDIDDHVDRELSRLNLQTSYGRPERLQIYREAFEYLIENFKTYQPFLASVKAEYDRNIERLNQKLSEAEPLKQMLVTVSEECESKIREAQLLERVEIDRLLRDRDKLLAKISSLKENQKGLEHHVQTLREKLAAEYHKFRDESDARKLLIQDYNELRYQQEDLLEAQRKKEAEGKAKIESGEDPILLRIALKKVREQEANLSAELNEMIANYSDVIPRRDFEALKKKHEANVEQFDALQADFDTLNTEHKTLLEVHQKVVQQRDEYLSECENLRRSATPRPDWGKCGEVIIGGIPRWRQVGAGKSSRDLLDTLLNELVVGSDDHPNEFDGLGTSDDIPPHLRAEGKIKRRHFQKRDVLVTIHQVWSEKISAEEDIPIDQRTELSEYLSEYLARNFPMPGLAKEWAYSIHDACQRMEQSETEVQFFKEVLNGEADEEILYDELEGRVRVHQYLEKCDAQMGNTGALSREVFQMALEQLYPDRSNDQIKALVDAAVEENSFKIEMTAAEKAKTEEAATPAPVKTGTPGGDGSTPKPSETPTDDGKGGIKFSWLFDVNDEGKTGAFLKELTKQSTDIRTAAANAIIDHIDASKTELISHDVKTGILAQDKDVNSDALNHYLCWTFGCLSDEFDLADPIPRAEALTRLSKTNLKIKLPTTTEK